MAALSRTSVASTPLPRLALPSPELGGAPACAVLPYSNPLSKALRFSSRKFGGTESATAFRTASALRKSGDRSEESNHYRVQHHALAQFFGEVRGRNAIDFFVIVLVGNAHQIFLDDQQSLRLYFVREAVVGLLRHDDQHVGPGYIG